MTNTNLDPRRMLRAVAMLLGMIAVSSARSHADEPADRFVARIASDPTVPPEARDLIRTTWEACEDCDGDEFLIQGLVLFSEEFRTALDAYDNDEYEDCIRRMGELRNDDNPFIATHAAVFEIKALIAVSRLAEASKRLEELMLDGGKDVSSFSYFLPEVVFLHGFCELSELNYDRAREILEGFWNDFPDAPQRLRISAQQMLAELSNRQPGRIGEVVDLMGFSGRHLSTGNSGEPVQQKQQRIIEILDSLIEEAEEQEQSGGGGSSSGGGSSRPMPQSPLQESRLPGGSGEKESLREARRANPAETWGSMPPAEREQILQALKDSFPRRYRQLVEQYYEELAKKP
jgi:hypothetical protein